MNKIFSSWREKPKLVYLLLFLFMIFPALFSYYAARGGSILGMILLLGLVILANIGAIFK